jgi:hypothetical protein
VFAGQSESSFPNILPAAHPPTCSEDTAMADTPSKYDQIRKLREARSLASERPDSKESVEMLNKKEIIVPKKGS